MNSKSNQSSSCYRYKLLFSWISLLHILDFFHIHCILKMCYKNTLIQGWGGKRVFFSTGVGKMNNLKICLGQVFWTIERYLSANFQVKWSSSEWGVAFWMSFLQFLGQNLVFLSNFLSIFCSTSRPSNLNKIWTVQSVSTFWHRSIYVKMNGKEEIRSYPPIPLIVYR